jgi:hypothetical protein
MGQEVQGIFAVIAGLADELVQDGGFLFFARGSVMGGRFPVTACFTLNDNPMVSSGPSTGGV